MKDVSENFRRHPRDVQQRVLSAFESNNFCIQGEAGVDVGLAVHPDGQTSVLHRKHIRMRSLTSMSVFAFERRAARRRFEFVVAKEKGVDQTSQTFIMYDA